MARRTASAVFAGAGALALALLVALAAAVLLLPAAQPSVTRPATLDVADVERALRLARSHDPRRALPGVVRTLRLSGHEAEVLLNQAAARLGGGAWQLELGVERVRVRGSVPVPHALRGEWLNIELVAQATRELPQLQSVKVGGLALPVKVVEWLLLQWADRHDLAGDAPVLALRRVTLQPTRLDVLYAWGPDAPARLTRVLLPPREHERLRLYAQRLTQVTAAARGAPQSVAEVLPPLFELARQRSAEGHEPGLENRAALLVLGLAANGVDLSVLQPGPAAASAPLRLTLAGRKDFPQHLLVSAAVAVDSGSGMADLLGLYKELADARWGSGFSFNDIAANRAGTRLGELAMREPQRLQGLLAGGGLAEADFMPDVSDLPEFMTEREFRSRYGDPASPAYRRMLGDIEDRLGATPLFRR